MHIAVAAYRGHVSDLKALLAHVQTHGSHYECELQLLDATRVMGPDHLQSAAQHATRAFTEGRNAAATRALETLRYASGERQIAKALQKMGLREGEQVPVAVVALGERAEEALAAIPGSFGWHRDDTLLAPDPAALPAFGITDEERAITPPERWPDLVLERVALVDVLK